jgi:hypothetical protein
VIFEMNENDFFEGFFGLPFFEDSFENFPHVQNQCVASMPFPICIRFYMLCMKTISKQFFEGFSGNFSECFFEGFLEDLFEAFEDFSHHVIQCVALMPFPICIRFYTLYMETIVNRH